MNLSRTLKTLPLVGALAMGLAITPAISMADDDNRGRHKDRYSHDAGKSHKKAHKQDHRAHKREWKRDHKGDHRSYRKHHGHKHVDNHRHGWKKRHGKHYGHKHGHRGHGHSHHGHRHEHVVVRDYGHHDHYLDFDDLRFVFGLHTDNVDIIFRD